MSLRQIWYSFVVASFLAATVLGTAWFYNHRHDPDIQTTALHVAVDSFPFLASIVFALWPEVSKVHIGWRTIILVGGLVWSGLLARKDYLDLQVSRKDQQSAISTAVNNANQHSDQKIDGVQSDLQTATAKLNGRLDNLSTLVLKSETDVVGTISKVGTAPTKYAQLQFSLFANDSSKLPITSETLPPDENGDFSIDFTATNVSDISAKGGELWVTICDECIFAKEPQGFDKPSGTIETMRHKNFGDLNPGVSIEKMTVEFKPSRKFSSMDLGFRYSCTTCGKIGAWQAIKIVSQFPVLQLPTIPPLKLN
jgi:hypothetical protein